MRDNCSKALTVLKCNYIFISEELITYKISEEGVQHVEDLSSDQEETDKKVMLHCHQALIDNDNVVVRSPSRDTDILIFALSLLDKSKVYFDYGNGQNESGLWLNEVSMEDITKEADIMHTQGMITFHLFSRKENHCVGKRCLRVKSF